MAARKLAPMLVVALLVAAASVAVFLAVGDVQAFLAEARDVSPVPLAFAVAFTCAAYFAFCATLVSSSWAGGRRIAFRDAIPVSFVSEALNNLVSTGGMGGIAIRIYGFGRRGVSAGVSVGMSAMTTLMGDAVVVLFLHIALGFLLVGGRLHGRALASIGAFSMFVVVVVTIVWSALRDGERRERLLGWISRRAERIARRTGRSDLEAGRGLAVFREDFVGFFRHAFAQPRRLALPYLCALADMSLRIACLGCAFWAIGHPLPPLVLLTGFAIGITAGALSLVPGGIGIVESSMAAAFALMGVELEVAAVAVVVFRVAYYVFPLVAVAVFFRSVVNGARAAEAAAADGPTRASPIR